MDPSLSRELLCKQAAALTVVMVSFVTTRLKRKRFDPEVEPDPLVYVLREQSELHRQRTLNMIYNSTDVECISMLRMKRAPFFALCTTFRERGLVTDREGVSVEEQVAMFLHVVGHNQRFRVVHQAFRRSIQTVHKHFHQVLYVVGELRKELIKAPSPTTHPKITGSYRWNPYLKDCIGAIDGTHVLARVPRHMQQAFRGRKTNPTQNVMVVVDFDLKFTYVLAGWEGSAHDALILADAIERDDGFTVPQGKFYLVDAGYACRTGFLPPSGGLGTI
ncbi:protein ALP1-like [Zea mays]|uniref:protein ALP1-like n=1 Tax=Zea mays TaxID=4577 RepID=UPI0009A9611B|nr:protein ALP1-like [Zea mays]|eukprot:XP_008660607.2 protein ALP1-like [Zea mays]